MHRQSAGKSRNRLNQLSLQHLPSRPTENRYVQVVSKRQFNRKSAQKSRKYLQKLGKKDENDQKIATRKT